MPEDYENGGQRSDRRDYQTKVTGKTRRIIDNDYGTNQRKGKTIVIGAYIITMHSALPDSRP